MVKGETLFHQRRCNKSRSLDTSAGVLEDYGFGLATTAIAHSPSGESLWPPNHQKRCLIVAMLTPLSSPSETARRSLTF